MPSSEHEITVRGPLLATDGRLTTAGWSREPLLDCNLELAAFYPRPLRFLQKLRVKRWDYYAVTTPAHFFSFTVADLGYAGQVFAYTIDFATGYYHEESITVAPGVVQQRAPITLPRNSTAGATHYSDGRKSLTFDVTPGGRHITVNWPGFDGKGLSADFSLRVPPGHDSTTVVIPIRGKRFYYNRKLNCLPALGTVQLGNERHELTPDRCLGNLDWGRGVWEYRSFWVWASASGFLPGGRTVGLNLGFGFGDTNAATENTVILDGCVHKLGQVGFTYDCANFKQPWHMASSDGRLDLVFTPFLERVAKTNLLVITSEVHQMFGRYSGIVVTDGGERIEIDGLVGFAEEHQARW